MSEISETSHEWSREYTQSGDGNSSGPQHIVISCQDCGGGSFYVIETDRWSFDSAAELLDLLRRAGVRVDGAGAVSAPEAPSKE